MKMSSEIDDNVTLSTDMSDDMNFTTIYNEIVSESLTTTAYNQTIDNFSNTTISDEPDIALYSVLCIKGFIFGSIIIGAVLGNALVILAVRRNRKLRYVRFFPFFFLLYNFYFLFFARIEETHFSNYSLFFPLPYFFDCCILSSFLPHSIFRFHFPSSYEKLYE